MSPAPVPYSPRVALVFQGDSALPSSWSGIPAGLAAGLKELGAQPVAVDARMPGSKRIARTFGMDWMAQTTNPFLAAAGGVRASAAIRRGGFDGVVTIGSGYGLRSAAPRVSFDDMTVAQALAQADSEYGSVSRRAARRWRGRQLQAYERSQTCCVASEWAARSVIDDYGIDPAKVDVVGLGRNLPQQLVERDWREPHFLFIGIDWERKRGQAVVDAFAWVRDRHPVATLDLVGGHPPIEAPGVTGHGVLPLGSADGQARHAALLARSTCMVLPSSFEPFGIAYVDAGASGVPSIGTTNGGAASAIGDGGLLVDPNDQDGLLDAMLAMCNPDTAKHFGDRAFLHSAGFTWQAVGERVLLALKRR
jgi:glycosyltransferase involved in cell wall biosynthesis